ncbi:MAG: hypothetical protein AB8B59_09675 [Maribacter sp.]
MKHVLFVLFFLLAFVKMQGQEILKTNEQVTGFRSIPKEQVFVHFNSSVVLTGEYFYYKLYCFKEQKKKLSDISKVAYVELVSEEGNQVFEHKIFLENGQGNGDVFIPTTVPSGSYKLLAYTRWMRNGSIKNFFQSAITIINPYQTDQTGIQKKQLTVVDSVSNDTIINKLNTPVKDLKMDSNIGPIQLSVGNEDFKKRSEVSVTLNGKNSQARINGNYSVSVRKKDGIKGVLPPKSNNFLELNDNEIVGYTQGKGEEVYLPELRGELFHGQVKAIDNSSSVKNLRIAVSIPVEDSYFDVVTTNSSGIFYFNVNEAYSGDQMFVQVLSNGAEKYDIILKKDNQVDYAKLVFEEVFIDPALKNEILQRSIHNQIENSYFQFRPDSVQSKLKSRISDNKERKVYILEDFTRFKTVRETIVEIIKNVSTQSIGKDDFVIKVKGFDYATPSEVLPLILLDGSIVQNHNAFLEYDARNIKDITVMRHELIFGPKIFLGVLIINTNNGNSYETVSEINSTSAIPIFKPQSDKNYFVQTYQEDAATSRLPDDRLQLLWQPKLRLDSDMVEINFFTSDVSGEYEIQIEGFSDDNLPVSIRKSIFVD